MAGQKNQVLDSHLPKQMKIAAILKTIISGIPKLGEKIVQAKIILRIAIIRLKYPKIFNTIPSTFISFSLKEKGTWSAPHAMLNWILISGTDNNSVIKADRH